MHPRSTYTVLVYVRRSRCLGTWVSKLNHGALAVKNTVKYLEFSGGQPRDCHGLLDLENSKCSHPRAPSGARARHWKLAQLNSQPGVARGQIPRAPISSRRSGIRAGIAVDHTRRPFHRPLGAISEARRRDRDGRDGRGESEVAESS